MERKCYCHECQELFPWEELASQEDFQGTRYEPAEFISWHEVCGSENIEEDVELCLVCKGYDDRGKEDGLCNKCKYHRNYRLKVKDLSSVTPLWYADLDIALEAVEVLEKVSKFEVEIFYVEEETGTEVTVEGV